MNPVPVLVISGAIASGKTTVLGEVSNLLAEVDATYLSVDFDAFTQVHPWPEGDRYGIRFGARSLASVWSNAASIGTERAVIASVVETQADLATILGAIPGADPFVVRLDVPVDVLKARVVQREIGSAQDWHLDRSQELVTILGDAGVEDATVSSDDRPIRTIALEILTAAGWPRPRV